MSRQSSADGGHAVWSKGSGAATKRALCGKLSLADMWRDFDLKRLQSSQLDCLVFPAATLHPQCNHGACAMVCVISARLVACYSSNFFLQTFFPLFCFFFPGSNFLFLFHSLHFCLFLMALWVTFRSAFCFSLFCPPALDGLCQVQVGYCSPFKYFCTTTFICFTKALRCTGWC